MDPNDTVVQDESSSLRDDLEAAFEAANEPATPEAPATGNDEPAPAPEREEADSGAARDERGRFTSKKAPADAHGAAPEEAGAKPVAGTPATGQPTDPPPPVEQPAPVERAPQSWKPAAREHWAALPPDVRAEVQRRESEVARTLQETATARREAEAFRSAYAPYEAMIRAEGGNPLSAVQNLFQTAAALRTAPPAHKAQLVAQLVQHYGVPIEALDAALVGQPPPQHAQQEFRDPRFDQFMAELEHAKRERAEAAQREQARAVEAFAKDKEFFEDVRPLMADIIEVASRRGEQISLDDAYTRAIAMRPDIAKVVAQRDAAAAAAKARASTQRARTAASSVRSAPAVSPKPKDENRSLRDDLEEALAEVQGR